MINHQSYGKYVVICDVCSAESRVVDEWTLFEVCFNETELQPGSVEGFDSSGWFVDVSQDHGLPDGHEHWCLDCWVKKTRRVVQPYRWLYYAAPLMVRIAEDVDTVRQLHLKVEGHRYPRGHL